MSLQEFLFYVIAGLTCLSAIGVVVSGNIVRQAAWLLFTLAGVSGLFFMLGASFVGATQLLVYVGGTLVLVIFGVMLTAQGPFITMKNSAGEWAISTVVGLLFFGVLATALAVSWPTTARPEPQPDVATAEQREALDRKQREQEARNVTSLGLSLLGVTRATPDGQVATLEKSAAESRPRKKIGYLLPFEIVSVHLLVVLVGAAYLARTKKRKGGHAHA